MSDIASNSSSKTNWTRVDALTDEDIDTTEAPALSEDFFRRARWRTPAPVSVTVRVDTDVLAWFQSQGEAGQRRMSAALRIYAEAHKET